MSTITRLKIYAAVIIAYLLFGLVEGFYDIWPWGAVIILTCILLAEIGTYISIKRNK